MKRKLLISAATVPIAAVAVFAGIQSYSHIEQLALRAAEPLVDARLMPLSLDGLIVAGVVIILAGYWLGWLCVVLGVAGTLFANLEWGLPHGALAATVATWPAVAFSVASFVLERWLKWLVGQGGQGGREWPENGIEPAPIPLHAEYIPATPGQVAAEGGQGGREVSADVANPVRNPNEVEPEPATAPPTVATCGHVLTGDPATVVVQAYLHGRDCLGEAPSQRSLAATYGLHRAKVAALVGPLNGQGGNDAALT